MNAFGAAERLGRLTPGDDYGRFIPLMDAVPPWLHGLWVLAGSLYLLAIADVVRRTGRAYLAILAAFSVEVVANLLARPIVGATGVVVNPNPSLIAAVVIPFILPLLLVVLLWHPGRQTPTSITASG